MFVTLKYIVDFCKNKTKKRLAPKWICLFLHPNRIKKYFFQLFGIKFDL